MYIRICTETHRARERSTQTKIDTYTHKYKKKYISIHINKQTLKLRWEN